MGQFVQSLCALTVSRSAIVARFSGYSHARKLESSGAYPVALLRGLDSEHHLSEDHTQRCSHACTSTHPIAPYMIILTYSAR